MVLTMYGMREWLGSGVIALCLLNIGLYTAFHHYLVAGSVLCGFSILAWVAVAAFFRDPRRKTPDNPNAIISPADGVVKDIEVLEFEHEDVFEDNKALRIGIFMSVLDVHINRAPCDLMIKGKSYKKGAYHDARDGRATKENESMIIFGEGNLGEFSFPIAVRQISGAIARRIVCSVTVNNFMEKGFKYGMIKFGSRVELHLPADDKFDIKLNVGDRVFGGYTIAAELKTS